MSTIYSDIIEWAKLHPKAAEALVAGTAGVFEPDDGKPPHNVLYALNSEVEYRRLDKPKEPS